MRHGRRSTTSFTLALALAATLAGCTPEPDDPAPEPAAEALAADLTDGTFDSAPIDDPAVADEQLVAILGDLAAFPREVTATVVEPAEGESATDGDAPQVRTVELTWSVDLGEGVDPLETTTSTTLTLTDPDGDGEESAAWTTAWSPTLVHPEATADSVIAVRRTQAVRGDVNGRDGDPIVIDRPVFRIGIDKANLTQDRWQPAAEALAAALELDDQPGYVQRVLDAGAAAFPVALTIRQGDEQSYDTQTLRGMEGVLLQEDSIPLAPTSTFARAILGGVGEATAEIVESSQGQVVAGDVVGTSGLQRTYDDQLRGTPATQVVLTDPAGDVLLGGRDAVEGTDLGTTLDVDLQIYAEQRLADVPSASAVVAIQPSTGAVLVAASGPGSAGLNTATVGQYAPGSTFKVATALALIRSGLTPDSPVECTPTVTVDGREFQNFPGYPAASVGTIPLREAIAQSCNTALISQNAAISSADVAEAAASLGIGASLPEGEAWPFPYFSGSVPTDATGTTHAADLIGQGDVLASPLAMAGVAASVAAGRTVVPALVEVAEPPVPVAPTVPLTTEEAQTLQELMYGVVQSGSSTFLQSVPGDPVGAKSGTAQFGTEDPPQTHAWMIAFQGDLAVAVLVEVGDYGTATAGPIISDVLTFAASAD